MKKVFCLMAISILTLWSYSAAQKQDLWTTFTKADGSVLSFVVAIQESQDGALWFCTTEGVRRFHDGTWTTFTTANGLAHNWLWTVHKSQSGALWFGTAGGVSRYQEGIWTTFTTADGLANNDVLSVQESQDGAIWFGTREGVSRYHRGVWTTFTVADGLAHNTVYAIEESRDGALWFGTWSKLSRYHEGKWTTFSTANGLAGNTITVIKETQDRALWFGTSYDGLSRYRDGVWTTFTADNTNNGLAGNTVTAIEESQDGTLWFGTYNGVSRYRNGDWTTFTTDKGLAHNNVYCILESRDGAMWFGTRGGVSRYEQSIWITLTTTDGLAHNWVRAIHESRDGALWFGTYGKISRYQEGFWTTLTPLEGRDFNEVWTIHESQDGALWFGTRLYGVSRYHEGLWTTFDTTDGLANNNVWAIEDTQNGALWFGTDKGASRYYEGAWTTFDTADGLANNKVWAIEEALDGALWFGTTGGGVSRYYQDIWTNFDTSDGLVDNSVWKIVETGDGALWFCTSAGVSRWYEGIWTPFTTADGLVHNTVGAMHVAKDAALWFGTELGVTRYYDGVWTTLTIGSTSGGLVDNNVYAIAESRDGALWFGTQKGVSRLWPDKIPPYTTILDGPIGISGSSTSQFIFTGQDYRTSVQKLTYTYAVAETSINQDQLRWQSSGHLTAIETTPLLNGTHTFYARAKDEWGIADPTPASWTFTVDITQPTVTINSHKAGEIVAGKVFLIGNAFDASPIHDFDKYELKYGFVKNGQNISAWDSVRFSFPRLTSKEVFNDTLAIWDTNGLDNGAYRLWLKAYDKLGHTSEIFLNVEVVKSMNQVRPNRGALLSVDSGQIELFIPPNALAQEEQVNIKECETVTRLNEPDVTFTNFCFEITSNREVVFAKPVTMTIKYPDLSGQNINEQKLAVYHSPNGQSDWVRLGGSVNTNEKKITTRFIQLGVFALYEDLTPGSESGISAVEINPRVFTPNSRGLRSKVDISYTLGQDGDVTCKVYNTAGRLIAIIEENEPKNHGENVASWYGRDLQGITCPSGLYMVTIQAGGEVKTKTVVVMNE